MLLEAQGTAKEAPHSPKAMTGCPKAPAKGSFHLKDGVPDPEE